jgi:hypothetical protein
MIKKLAENRVLAYSLILTAVVLLIIPFIRFFYYENIPIGEQQYYHARISQYILENGVPEKDTLIDSPYLFQPFHLILAGLFSFLGASLPSFLLPFLLGILSIILFYCILKDLGINILNKFFALFILIISPVFIYTFSTLNSYSFPVTILLLAFFFFMKKNKFYFVLSLVLFAVIPFFNFAGVVFSILLLLVYTLNNKKKIKRFYNIAWITGAVALVKYIIYLIKYGIPYISLNSAVLVNYLSELGGILSFGIFNLILAAIGLYLMWNKKKQILGYIIIFVAFLFSLYFNSINIYLNFIFAIAAGHAFVYIVKMRYSLSIIKKLTIGLLLFGLVFSAVSYMARTSTLLPDDSIADSLEWLKANSKPENIVFSHYKKGEWIQAIAERPVLLNSNLIYIKDVKAKLNDSDTIFYSRTLKKTVSLLDKYNISYIWIDSEMNKGLVWTKEDEGLLFLFSNKENFEKLYDKQGIEIWKVKR